MINNSIKQLKRSSVKLIVLIISVIITVAFLIIGSNLLIDTKFKIEHLENSYATIGTVEQKESTTKIESVWDASKKQYTNYRMPAYDQKISENILDFKNADYIVKPEKRPYYGAYLPTYDNHFEEDNYMTSADLYLVVEFSPVEDVIPDHPVMVNIEQVLMGESRENEQLMICSHYQESPPMLLKNHTYIATLMAQENTHTDMNDIHEEWVITGMAPSSTQRDKSGNLIESDLNKVPIYFEEVAQNFYKERGQYWINMIESLQRLKKTVPVLPTNSIMVLPSFHKKESVIVEGRSINEDEFNNGNRVCMLQKKFAEKNQIKIGDSIELPLYFADYRNPSSIAFGIGGAYDFSLLNAKGDVYPIFSNQNYEVVGIYDFKNIQGEQMSGSTEMAYDLIIIPSHSLSDSDELNRLDDGVMLHTTTSFIIPNGSIENYKQMFNQIKGHDQLEVSFNDNGYDMMKKTFEKTYVTSCLLLAAGVFASMIICTLIIYFFIVKQKKRLAIERSLGMNKKQCRVSMLSGLFMVVIVASLIGSFIATMFITWNHQDLSFRNETYYSTKFSLYNDVEITMDNNVIADVPIYFNLLLSVCIPILFTFSVLSIAIIYTDHLYKTDILTLIEKDD